MAKGLLPTVFSYSLVAVTSQKISSMGIRMISLCLFLLMTCSCQQTAKSLIIFEKAAVVSAHPLATQVGVEILKAGGNAIDAAVGVHFALAVVYPAAGNLGGGGFLVTRSPEGEVHTIDFREKAPAASSRDMYLDESGEVIPDLSTLGHLAAGVPGTVDGMWTAHDSLGNLPWEQLIQPAIDLAVNGFALTEKEANGLNAKQEKFERVNTREGIWWSKEAYAEGDSIVLPDLANTLRLIRDLGPAGFYEGAVADSIVAEMNRGNGIMTLEDLYNYEPVWRNPIRGTYRGCEIISMAPPSSGGIALVQLLKMIEPFPIGEYGWNSVEAVHLMTEAERRVYADRSTHLGDMDFWSVPVEGLLQKSYTDERMKSFDHNQATLSDSIKAGSPQIYESAQTTHYSIVDEDGRAVSVTTTLNGGFGSCVLVGGAGFFLNNEMDDFSSKPGVPNLYGLLGAEANAIEPGKRMLSSMTPTIVTRGDSLYMVVGTPGGSTIITSVFQNIVNVVDHGMGMQASVSAPRFHHQWLPDLIHYEEGALSNETIQSLENMGHEVSTRGSIGRVDAILVRTDGKLETGADHRGDDWSNGY